MEFMSFMFGLSLIAMTGGGGVLLFKAVTYQVSEQTEVFVLKFGKITRKLTEPGLYWLPDKLWPWVQVISVSKQTDGRLFKDIQLSDRFGTTIVVDLWVEFKISNAHRALFIVESWEEVLESVVLHSATAILSTFDIEQILKNRLELAARIRSSIEAESERWGLSLHSAMIQNVGLLPDTSKRMFQSVAARIERTSALVQEEGRLRVAELEAETSRKIAELNGISRSQNLIALGKFYRSLDHRTLGKFREYWELHNTDPKKLVTFAGFGGHPLELAEAVKSVEALTSH
jgi:regulator of protease activity HflC (stomatin/prohibitin superfamily)